MQTNIYFLFEHQSIPTDNPFRENCKKVRYPEYFNFERINLINFIKPS